MKRQSSPSTRSIKQTSPSEPSSPQSPMTHSHSQYQHHISTPHPPPSSEYQYPASPHPNNSSTKISPLQTDPADNTRIARQSPLEQKGGGSTRGGSGEAGDGGRVQYLQFPYTHHRYTDIVIPRPRESDINYTMR